MTAAPPISPLDIARTAWGEGLPDWVEVLARECGRSNQVAVARALGRTPSVISQVLRNVYAASTVRIEERVRGVFLNVTVACPAEGALPLQLCQDWREKSRAFAIGNPLRARMYRACNACPRNRREDEE